MDPSPYCKQTFHLASSSCPSPTASLMSKKISEAFLPLSQPFLPYIWPPSPRINLTTASDIACQIPPSQFTQKVLQNNAETQVKINQLWTAQWLQQWKSSGFQSWTEAPYPRSQVESKLATYGNLSLTWKWFEVLESTSLLFSSWDQTLGKHTLPVFRRCWLAKQLNLGLVTMWYMMQL